MSLTGKGNRENLFLLPWYLSSNKVIELEDATWLEDQARGLSDIELVAQNGKIITRASLKGNWSLMFFGYTHYPDICPTTMQTMTEMVRVIDDPDVRDAVQVYFVSVDPGRDTPDVLTSYAGLAPLVIALLPCAAKCKSKTVLLLVSI